jgi:hypothetical protein
MTVKNSRKKSPVTYSEIPLFFSLVDYRNNYYTSNDPNKIIEFYNGFDNREQLIQWMRERPKGIANIREVDGDKDIIVVIPTADFNGKYAKECRENIFKSLHIIFVESGEVPDPYFNYAHNCNVGIKKAMEYNPKWVVVSNDDLIKYDHVGLLLQELRSIDNNSYFSVFTKREIYHSMPQRIGSARRIPFFIYLQCKRVYLNIKRMGEFYKLEYEILSKYLPKIRQVSNRLFDRILYKTVYSFTLTGDFSILSSKFLVKERITAFDETFVNGGEDADLSILLSRFKSKVIDYKIIDIIGGTFGGQNRKRWLRDYVNVVYLDQKITDILFLNIENR